MDPFALLDLPRQPWLDPAQVRAAFQTKARALHPDAPGGNADAFAALNSAQRALAAPASRLRLLLGDTPVPAAPPDAALGFRLGAFLHEADAHLAKRRAAASPLARALLAADTAQLSRTLAELQTALAALQTTAHTALREANAADLPTLAALAGAFTYLDRWQKQLAARALELRIVNEGKSAENAEDAENKK